ncbi:MAG: helix-turn-helix transcriptional regulator [Gemmatimonadaceae bacterium]|nr:helix-turn-helix transcriptional regulator [Gemmatimonadaceae bacterium]
MSPARFRLQEVIDAKGTSQSQLSRDSGVSFATISRMCRNVTAQVSLATLDKLASALNVEVGDLIQREPKGRRK